MNSSDKITIVYDGDCPFCSAFVSMVRLREAAGSVFLVDARDSYDPAVQRLKREKYDLNEGMALVMGDVETGTVFHGDDCMYQISMLTSQSGVFNRLNYVVFRNPRRAKILYPWLRRGRNLALRLLNRDKIDMGTSI